MARGGIEPPNLPIFSRMLYQLSYLAGNVRAENPDRAATPTGLEPATSAVTGRRANQLRYGAWMMPTRAAPVTPGERRASGPTLTHVRARRGIGRGVRSRCPQRDSNPRCRLERAES